MKIFFDRQKAGQKLAKILAQEMPVIADGIVLALPRGGVPVAAAVAKALNLPLDILVTRKIGHPDNPEYAVAAVSENKIVLNEKEKIEPKYLQEQVKKEREEIIRRQQAYRQSKIAPILKDKTVILVDDGLATGLTALAAASELKFLKAAKIILAVPVAPPDALEKIRPLFDRVVILRTEPNFWAVSQFYQNFAQVEDGEVVKMLKRF